MTGGLLVGLAGVWVLCQVFGGNALGRIGLTGKAQASADAQAAADAAASADAIAQLYDPTKQGSPTVPIPGSLSSALGSVSGSVNGSAPAGVS